MITLYVVSMLHSCNKSMSFGGIDNVINVELSHEIWRMFL